MKRYLFLIALAACGDNTEGGPLVYHDPSGGKLRLVRNANATPTEMMLDLVVGDAPLDGFATGFDLPLDGTKVHAAGITPGSALDPGPAPHAAKAVIPHDGPLANQLVVALSQKATVTPMDAHLPAGAVLLTLTLEPAARTPGVVFDGQDPAFVLPSGGLRDRLGVTIVEPKDVAIGTLLVK